MKKVNLTGILVPGDWDEDGLCLTVMLFSDDEKVYLLKEKRAEGSLMNHLRSRARINGAVEVDGGTAFVRVEQYELLDH